MYHTVTVPLFDYADVVLDSSHKKYTDQLQKLQTMAGRLILGIDIQSCNAPNFKLEIIKIPTFETYALIVLQTYK